MEIRETANLLAKAALLDSRVVTPAVVAAWHEAIGHHDYADALAALDTHRQTSSEYLMPSHINDIVPVIKRNRELVEASMRAVKALPPSPRAAPPEWFSSGRPRKQDPPPDIPCPWCGARPKARCTVRGTDKPMRRPHPARTEALAAAGASSVPETEEEPW